MSSSERIYNKGDKVYKKEHDRRSDDIGDFDQRKFFLKIALISSLGGLSGFGGTVVYGTTVENHCDDVLAGEVEASDEIVGSCGALLNQEASGITRIRGLFETTDHLINEAHTSPQR